jgi:Na+/proline symporter
MQTAAVSALFVSLAVYILVSLYDARRVKTTAGFLHDAGLPWRAVVSLTAFSLTLGTGLVYVLSQAKTTGILIFLTPFGVFLGYAAIAFYYRRLAYRAGAPAPNIFFLLGDRQNDGTYRLSWFGWAFGLFMALTYVLLLGFELEVGSEIIMNSLLADPKPEAHIGFALIIYGVVAVYTALGGLRAAVSTDVFQAIFIVVFIVALALLLAAAEPGQTASTTQAAARDEILAGTTAALLLIIAVTTQFYSIVNVNMGSGYEPRRQFQIFMIVGIASGLVYALVAVLGLYLGTAKGFSDLVQGYIASDAAPSLRSSFIAFSIFAGMLAVLMSTLDNMTIAVTQIVSENMFRLNPFHKRENEAGALAKLRIAHAVVSTGVIGFMLITVHFFEDPFTTLLTILFAATVMSPLIAVAAWIGSRGGRSIMHNSILAWVVFGSMAIAWVWYGKLTLEKAQQESVWLHLAAFGIAFMISMFDLVTWRKRFRSGATATGGTDGRSRALPQEVV